MKKYNIVLITLLTILLIFNPTKKVYASNKTPDGYKREWGWEDWTDSEIYKQTWGFATSVIGYVFGMSDTEYEQNAENYRTYLQSRNLVRENIYTLNEDGSVSINPDLYQGTYDYIMSTIHNTSGIVYLSQRKFTEYELRMFNTQDYSETGIFANDMFKKWKSDVKNGNPCVIYWNANNGNNLVSYYEISCFKDYPVIAGNYNSITEYQTDSTPRYFAYDAEKGRIKFNHYSSIGYNDMTLWSIDSDVRINKLLNPSDGYFYAYFGKTIPCWINTESYLRYYNHEPTEIVSDNFMNYDNDNMKDYLRLPQENVFNNNWQAIYNNTYNGLKEKEVKQMFDDMNEQNIELLEDIKDKLDKQNDLLADVKKYLSKIKGTTSDILKMILHGLDDLEDLSYNLKKWINPIEKLGKEIKTILSDNFEEFIANHEIIKDKIEKIRLFFHTTVVPDVDGKGGMHMFNIYDFYELWRYTFGYKTDDGSWRMYNFYSGIGGFKDAIQKNHKMLMADLDYFMTYTDDENNLVRYNLHDVAEYVVTKIINSLSALDYLIIHIDQTIVNAKDEIVRAVKELAINITNNNHNTDDDSSDSFWSRLKKRLKQIFGDLLGDLIEAIVNSIMKLFKAILEFVTDIFVNVLKMIKGWFLQSLNKFFLALGTEFEKPQFITNTNNVVTTVYESLPTDVTAFIGIIVTALATIWFIKAMI